MSQTKLLIATPSITGDFCGEYVGSLIRTLSLLQQRKISAEWYFVRGISEIGRARDHIAAYALRNDFTHLLFIDADEGWRPEHIGFLLDSESPIVGGTYLKKEFPLNLNFGVLPQHGAYFPDTHKYPEQYERWVAECSDERGEIPVAYLPTGFLLIRTEVFEGMKEHAPDYLTRDAATAEEVRCWEFFPIGVINGRKQTEDWGFCEFARACGFPIKLQTKAIADHIGRFSYRYFPPQQQAPEKQTTKDGENEISNRTDSVPPASGITGSME